MNYLRVGLIARPHGVHGDVKVIPLTDNTERFRELKEAFIENNGAYEPVLVSNTRFQPNVAYVALSCSKSIEDAERLRNLYLCVDRAHAVQLPQGRYFIADLIGCDVFDSDGDSLGTLTDVLETGANDVYVIEGSRRLLVPALKKLLLSVDIANKRIALDSNTLSEVGLFED